MPLQFTVTVRNKTNYLLTLPLRVLRNGGTFPYISLWTLVTTLVTLCLKNCSFHLPHGLEPLDFKYIFSSDYCHFSD